MAPATVHRMQETKVKQTGERESEKWRRLAQLRESPARQTGISQLECEGQKGTCPVFALVWRAPHLIITRGTASTTKDELVLGLEGSSKKIYYGGRQQCASDTTSVSTDMVVLGNDFKTRGSLASLRGRHTASPASLGHARGVGGELDAARRKL